MLLRFFKDEPIHKNQEHKRGGKYSFSSNPFFIGQIRGCLEGNKEEVLEPKCQNIKKQ